MLLLSSALVGPTPHWSCCHWCNGPIRDIILKADENIIDVLSDVQESRQAKNKPTLRIHWLVRHNCNC